MLYFIFKRCIESTIVILGIILITFILMNIIPGNAVTAMMGKKIDKSTYTRVVSEMELEKPVTERFENYISDLSKGHLGKSIIMKRNVIDLIAEVLPNTFKLTISSIIFAWIIGILSGILSALFPNGYIDRVMTFGSVVGISVPTFLIAIVLQYVFAYKLNLVPISGFSSLRQLILPSIVIGWGMSGEISRVLRANMIEICEKEFVQLAKSKGRRDIGVVVFHSLKVSILPVLTIMMLQFTSLLGGAMITESIFGIPGIGTLSVSALTNRDLPVLQGVILIGTLVIVIGNLIADILYSIIDPRIRV